MSQSGLTDLARESAWDAWYIDHLRIMASVPGVTSAQRFKTSTADHPRSLALYSIASADVFNDPYYQSIRGMGEWLQLIDRRYYRRNLFTGLDYAPAVDDGQVLLVADRPQPDPGLTAPWAWLECVGVDRSTPYRGIAVMDRAEAQHMTAGGIAVYSPATTIVRQK